MFCVHAASTVQGKQGISRNGKTQEILKFAKIQAKHKELLCLHSKFIA